MRRRQLLNVTVQKYAPKWYAILKSAHHLELAHDVGLAHDVSLTCVCWDNIFLSFAISQFDVLSFIFVEITEF